MTNKLSNEELADELETMYMPDGGDFLDEAAKRLREYDNNILKAQLEQVIDIVKYMQTFACDAETIENEFL